MSIGHGEALGNPGCPEPIVMAVDLDEAFTGYLCQAGTTVESSIDYNYRLPGHSDRGAKI